MTGETGAPVARLTPLGWICLGVPGQLVTDSLYGSSDVTFFQQ